MFAERPRRYPLAADLGQADPEATGEHDTRYPRLTTQEVIDAQPELILLPDEPYAFDETHVLQVREAFASTPAAKSGRILPVDGRLVTWHGTRMARALSDLPALFSNTPEPGAGTSRPASV